MATKKASPKKAATNAVRALTAPRMSAEDKKWQARDNLGTLRRAQEIRNDPDRVKAAQAEAQQQMKALAQVAKK